MSADRPSAPPRPPPRPLRAVVRRGPPGILPAVGRLPPVVPRSRWRRGLIDSGAESREAWSAITRPCRPRRPRAVSSLPASARGGASRPTAPSANGH